MKIVIAGAGIGGMVAAEKLGKLGFEVTVYEQSPSLDEMRYDWHDDVNPKVFRRLGMEMPAESNKKKSWTFISPFGAVIREFRQDENNADYSVERRPINRMLYNRACDVAKFVFGANVTAPIVRGNRVAGIVVNGEEVEADLVVDSLGVDSVLRKGLPHSMGITQYRPDEVFVAYRAFYEKNPDAPEPKYTNKVYLKHMGAPGISWAIQDHDPTLVNVLVGRIGALDEKTLAEALDDLRKHNPTIGDKVVRGGEICKIPVRYPATRMVANGYAAVGDSAYLTIPMLGSGIATSMLAGAMLAQSIGENMSHGVKGAELFKVGKLWRYQVRIFRDFGAEHCAVDVMKRSVLTMKNEVLDWLLGSDLLTNEEMGKLASGKIIKIGFGEAVRKIKVAGVNKLGRLISINNMLQKSYFAASGAKNIPRNYTDSITKTWEAHMMRFYKLTAKQKKALGH